ncbi:MAG: hypothetical protein ACI8QT_000940 [Halioglobus sp.]|jgi:hypothetical protein
MSTNTENMPDHIGHITDARAPRYRYLTHGQTMNYLMRNLL